MHAHYVWITKTCGLYSSHDALQVPNLLGVSASVCTPLPTRTQQLPTLLAQQCWGLLRPFARSLKHNCELRLWDFLRLLSQKTNILQKFSELQLSSVLFNPWIS